MKARESARQLRETVSDGKDPVAAKKEARLALAAKSAALTTFRDCAEKYIFAKGAEWKNDKHQQQWVNTLQTYAYPVIGHLAVAEVELAHVTKILEPIWKNKTETASRLRGRIESVLGWATVHGYRTGDNPARWRGHLDKLFGARGKIKKVKHHRAMPINEVAAFLKKLRDKDGIGALALEFTILTAARSGEVLGARWSEFDLKAGVWTIPAERMKAKRQHRVPLSPAVVKIIKSIPRMAGNEFIFSGTKGHLSNMAMLAVLRKMKVDAVPHGFRSTFRDWCSEHTNYPRELAEMALAHTIESKVEAAYRQGDLFEKRRLLMKEWARFCETPAAKPSAKVVAIRKSR